MESYVHKKIELKNISAEFPYSCRWRCGDSNLRQSMERHGLLMPVVVLEEKGNAVVLAGHARVMAARELGWKDIPVMAVQAQKNPRDWFLFSLLSNWNQAWTDLDRCFVIERARKAGFGDKEILEDVLPALGLTPEKRWIDEAAEVMSLAPEVLNALHEGRLPFRGVRSLTAFSAADQKFFAQTLAGPVSLTSNQLIKVCEWANDWVKSNKGNLETLLGRPDVDKVLKHPEWNPRQKGELFCHAVRCLRFPELVRKEEAFMSAAERLAQEARNEKSDFVLEAPPYFEAEGITLRARLKDPQELDRIMEVIQRKRNLFNSLFDIVL